MHIVVRQPKKDCTHDSNDNNDNNNDNDGNNKKINNE